MTDIVPALYVNITGRCNMRCEYCPINGENWEDSQAPLSVDRLVSIVCAARDFGIETFRISGGEPMLYPAKVLRLISCLNERGIDGIILNTNGFNLFRYYKDFENLRLKKLKISIDTFDRTLFETITGSQLYDRVLRSIERFANSRHLLEANVVVIKKNVSQVNATINRAFGLGLDVKLLDLVCYDSLVRGVGNAKEYWTANYVPLEDLMPAFRDVYGEPQLVQLSGGRGIPMWEYRNRDGRRLTLKSGTNGSTFGSICKNCPHYPCQEGLFHMSLSADGNLTPCRIRRDLIVSVARCTDAETRDIIRTNLEVFQNAYFLREIVQHPERET